MASFQEVPLRYTDCSHEVLDEEYQTVFTVPSNLRTFRVDVRDGVFYVDEHHLSNLSDVFRTMMVEGPFREVTKRRAVFHEESAADFHVLLKATCPYEMGISPKEVEIENVLILLQLADRYLILPLQASCMNLLRKTGISQLPADQLVDIFNIVLRIQSTRTEEHYFVATVILRGLVKRIFLESDDLLKTCDDVTREDVEQIVNSVSRLRHNQISTICRTKRRKCECCHVPDETISGEMECSGCSHSMCAVCLQAPCDALLITWLTDLLHENAPKKSPRV